MANKASKATKATGKAGKGTTAERMRAVSASEAIPLGQPTRRRGRAAPAEQAPRGGAEPAGKAQGRGRRGRRATEAVPAVAEAVQAQAAPAADPGLAERVAAAQRLRERTIAVSLECGVFQVERKVKGDAVDVRGETEGEHTDRQLLNVRKRLLECDEYRGCLKARYAISAVLWAEAFPSYLRAGLFAVPVARVPQIEAALTAARERMDQAVDAFCQVYPERVEAMRERLGPLFDARDYPPVEAMRAQWRASWRYLDLNAPSRLAEIAPDVAAADLVRAENYWQEAAEQTRQLLRGVMLDLVGRLAEALQPGEDGKARVVRQAHVDKLLEFVGSFASRDVTGDAELAGRVAEVQRLIGGVDMETLRTDEAFRQRMAADLAAVRDQVCGMTHAVGTRDIELPDVA